MPNPLTLASAVIMLFLFGERTRESAGKLLGKEKRTPWLIFAGVMGVYILLGFFSGAWSGMSVGEGMSDFITIFLYFFVPTLLIVFADGWSDKINLFDVLAVLAVWLPFDLRLITKSWFNASLNDYGYYLTAVFAVIYAFLIFGCWRGFPLRARWSLSKKDITWVLGSFVVLAAILIPLGIKLSFLSIGIDDRFYAQPYLAPLVFVAIFLAPAIPEELLFRGLLQNALSARLTRFWGWITASVLFGFAHLDNTVRVASMGAEWMFPNWRYVLMATIAGLFYGWIYNRRKSLLAAVLLHMLVDSVWVIFLRG